MSCCAKKVESESPLSPDELRESVREHYAQIATKDSSSSSSCCGDGGNSCYAPSSDPSYASKLGYSAEELESVPDGANLGLGCGNPVIFAGLREGETVLDLGSGAGFDAFISRRKVGENGKVIGVDMTTQMIAKARENARKNNYTNVEFRLGEIEHLPVGDGCVDVVISNCVINLVPESSKSQVFKECYRVLKSGGRICISDVVTSVELPLIIREEIKNYAGCLNGATLLSSLEGYLESAGFKNIKITPKEESKEFIKSWAPGHKVTDLIISALIQAQK